MMGRTFQSATLKLTGWYLLIIFLVCLMFSFIVYNVSSRELSMRLQSQTAAAVQQIPAFRSSATQLDAILNQQLREGQRNLKLSLLYTNIAVLTVGGAGSYLLARRTLQPIEEAHDAQMRFTGDVSHELRTPLATMQTEIEVMLRDKGATKPGLTTLLKSNLEEVERMRGLSDALLRLSQLQNQDVGREKVEMKQLVEEAAQRIMPEAHLKGMTIETSLRPVAVLGNGTILRELITILLDNAVKYNLSHQPIELHLQKKGATAVLKVIDHGIGIKRKDLPYIFDRFYRGDTSRTKNGASGYGLGLSLADEIVDMHEGTITASSSKKGTTFTVMLPTDRL